MLGSASARQYCFSSTAGLKLNIQNQYYDVPRVGASRPLLKRGVSSFFSLDASAASAVAAVADFVILTLHALEANEIGSGAPRRRGSAGTKGGKNLIKVSMLISAIPAQGFTREARVCVAASFVAPRIVFGRNRMSRAVPGGSL